MAASPTQLTLKLLRDEGWTVEVVERWIPGANIRKDLFGFIDLMALRSGMTLAVQATSYSNISARVKKIENAELLSEIRKCSWHIWVIGWRKQNNRWVHKIVDCS
jgi:Trm5-related predicted tRNA methylase